MFAVWPQHLWPQRANIEVLIHVRNTLVDRAFKHDGIGIQKQDVAPARNGESLIIGSSKTAVIPVFDELNLRKLLSDHLCGAIRTGVINDDNFKSRRFRLLVN